MRETIYKEFSSNRWNYWTNVEGRKINLSERNFLLMKDQGAKVVNVM